MSNTVYTYADGYDSTNSVAIIWAIEDVRSVIDDYDMNVQLSDEECMEVLHNLCNRHDANFGINWDVIHDAIIDLVEER